MIVSGVVSIPSSAGSSTVFTVTGTRTLEYAQAFQAYLDQALASGTLNIVQGDTVGTTVTFGAAIDGQVNEAVLINSDSIVSGSGLTATVPAGYQFMFDAIDGPTTITGNGEGGDVLVEGANAAATYFDVGGNNSIVFVDGNNHYVGDASSNSGDDHIVAGAGFDTIDTGYGLATVNSGTGSAVITLNDTATGAAGTFNDYVYLDDGQSTINANGMRDAIIANAPGQTIDGGTGTGQYDGIVLLSGNGGGDDVINGGSATVSLFDFSDGNSIFGGTGTFIFIGGTDVGASIVGGSGTTYMFGGAGDSVAFAASDTTSTASFLAGSGNETLNGALAQNALSIYGNNDSDTAVTSGVSDSLLGGSGNDTLVSGAGYETLAGGAGHNLFVIDATTDGVGGHITIADFNAGTDNMLAFANYSQTDIENALNGAMTVTGAGGETDTVITLSDNTQVTFIGVTSLSGHVIT
jgi:Ca2+-binding RTX toxin-like protein